MYIGAWTEYRLAQEQAQTSGRQNAARSAAGGHRKGSGIYHPSLSNKGGMEVAGLPDRESFRRTLESALSSNLAADDAENISQVLEPLMQRLPSIHPAMPAASRKRPGGRKPVSMSRSAPLPCRQHKRKALTRRCGGGGPSRYIYTRSDAGTGRAVEPTSDGTRSTRSGFSAATAPLDTAAGLEEHRARSSRLYGGSRNGGFGFGGQARQGKPGGRSRTSSHLPLIIDTRRRRRNTHGSGTTYPGNNHRINTTLGSSRGGSLSIEPSESCKGDDEDSSSCGTNNIRPFTSTPTHVRDGVGQYEEEVAPERGGYNGGAAATILRMARRRNPVGLKADFEQFWTWKRKAPTPTSTRGDRGTSSVPTRNASSEREVGAGGRSDAAASKLEALERMKMVYMTKENDDSGGIPATTTPSTASPGGRTPTTTVPSTDLRPPDNVARAPHCEVAQTTHSPTEFSGSAHLQLLRKTEGETDLMAQQDREGSGSDEAMTKPGAHDGGSSFGEGGGGAAVDVPDLELTESRIRQVEKYFGGRGCGDGGTAGLWRRRPNEGGNTGHMLAGEPAESLGLKQPSARAPAGKIAEDHVGISVVRSGIDGGDGGDGGGCGRRSTRNFGDGDSDREKDASVVEHVGGPGTPRRRHNLEASGLPQPAGSAAAAAAGAAARAPETAGRRDERALTSGSLGGSGQQGGVSSQSTTERGKLEVQLSSEGKKSPFSSWGGAEQVPSPNSVAPAWCCGDNSSLEDLVCWTRGLDYDAAVKGL